MREVSQLLRRYIVLTVAFVAFIAAYVWLTLTTLPSPLALERYHVSVTQLHEVQLAVIVPYMVIWLIGLVAYMRLQNYTRAIGDGHDGKAFRTITHGVLLLVLWLPISALLSSFATRYFGGHVAATATLVRVVNYSNIIILLPAFALIYAGSKRLVAVAQADPHGLTQRQSMLYIVFAVLYVLIALSDSTRQIASDRVATATYYLPDWATVITILIPRLLIWYIALAAVANIVLYSRKVKGAIYREALRSLALGLGVVVGGITLLRILQSLSTTLAGWGLILMLLLIYVLLCVLGFGYFMLAKGAKRLLKIEQL